MHVVIWGIASSIAGEPTCCTHTYSMYMCKSCYLENSLNFSTQPLRNKKMHMQARLASSDASHRVLTLQHTRKWQHNKVAGSPARVTQHDAGTQQPTSSWTREGMSFQ